MLLHMFREEETNDKQDFSLRHGYITCTYILHTYIPVRTYVHRSRATYVHGAMCSTSHTISSQHMHFFTLLCTGVVESKPML